MNERSFNSYVSQTHSFDSYISNVHTFNSYLDNVHSFNSYFDGFVASDSLQLKFIQSIPITITNISLLKGLGSVWFDETMTLELSSVNFRQDLYFPITMENIVEIAFKFSESLQNINIELPILFEITMFLGQFIFPNSIDMSLNIEINIENRKYYTIGDWCPYTLGDLYPMTLEQMFYQLV